MSNHTKKYFEAQIEDVEPLTEESIEGMQQSRIDAGMSTESLNLFVPGDKLLVALIYNQEPGTEFGRIDFVKVLESEIEEFCKNLEFVDMTGPTSSIPRFKPL